MKLNILVLGRNPEIMETVLRLINKNESWSGIGALSNEDAVRTFNSSDVDIVLLTNGIEPVSEKQLCDYFRKRKPSILIIQHYDGGSGLLMNEIRFALDNYSNSK